MKRRAAHFAHAEDALSILLGGVESERRARTRYYTIPGGRGRGWLRLPEKPWQQRVLIKPRTLKNGGGKGAPWYKHGVYLQRHGAAREGPGLGFTAEREDVSLSKLYGQWQRERDPHVFRLILSAEHAERLDLHAYARRFMERVEKDLKVQTQWAAIAHYDTRKPHLHLSIRGRDTHGDELRIDSEYLWGGMKQRAREVATEMLGYRLAPEIEAARARATRSQWWNELDQALFTKVHEHRIPEDTLLTAHERARLETLAERGLAWKDDGQGWEVSRRWHTLKHGKPGHRAPVRERARGHTEERGIEW